MNTYHIEQTLSHRGPYYASETVHVGSIVKNCSSWEEAVAEAKRHAEINHVNSFSATERGVDGPAKPLIRYRTFCVGHSGQMQDGGEIAT